MVQRRPLPLAAILLLCAALGSCIDRDNPFDQARCEPACSEGKTCFEGQCIDNPCPADMSFVPLNRIEPSHTVLPQGPRTRTGDHYPYCVDRFEASGVANLPASSAKGSMPWVDISSTRAYLACRAANKRLCRRDELDFARSGSKSQGCATGLGLVPTGSRPQCEGFVDGVFDLIGNANEFSLVCADDASKYNCTFQGSAPSERVGFRCCLPCATDGKSCPTDPSLWVTYELSDPTVKIAASAIFAQAADDIWAVDAKHAVHFDGASWTIDTQQSAEAWIAAAPRAVWAAAKDDVWIVGAKIMRWDGKAWSVVPSPATSPVTSLATSPLKSPEKSPRVKRP